MSQPDTLPIENLTVSDPSESRSATPHAEPPLTCPVTGQTMSADTPSPHKGSTIQDIDPEGIVDFLDERIRYLTDFLGFGKPQWEIIQKIAPLVMDMIPQMVDDMYAKLFEYSITKQVFMNRGRGFDGPIPNTLEELTLDSAQIVYRKIFMKSWARRVLTADYSSGKTWAYMDKVGKMHTGVVTFKHRGSKPLNVPYRDCALTLGWITTVLQSAILRVPDDKLTMEEKSLAIAAINQVIWIQNDLFARHYINEL